MKQGWDVTGNQPRELPHWRPCTNQLCHPCCWEVVVYGRWSVAHWGLIVSYFSVIFVSGWLKENSIGYFQTLNNVSCHLCINCKFNSILAFSRLSDSRDIIKPRSSQALSQSLYMLPWSLEQVNTYNVSLTIFLYTLNMIVYK